MSRTTPSLLLASVAVGALAGCGSPNAVNVELRRERDKHLAEIASLQDQLAADRARIQALESQTGTLPTLPQARLDALFTTHDIRLGRGTGGADTDPSKPGDEAIKVYLEPLEEAGRPLKATGHVTVELFNLDRPSDARIAHWEFTPQQTKDYWRELGPLFSFVFTCPLDVIPKSRDLLLRVTFKDELTGRTFNKVQQIQVNLPPTTQPVAQP